jgi:hypothetical protein
VLAVAHTYNPRYSGGNDQEDRSSKPTGQIVQEMISQKKKKNPQTQKNAGGIGPEFKLHTPAKINLTPSSPFPFLYLPKEGK